MGRRRGVSAGLVFIALGFGLMITLVFPFKFVVVVLSIALVICGAALCKK